MATHHQKVNDEWLDCFEKVLEENKFAVYLSAKKVVKLVNYEYCGDIDYMAYQTFRDWVDGKIKSEDNQPIMKRLQHLWEVSKINNEMKLLHDFQQAKAGQWQKVAWLLERMHDSDWLDPRIAKGGAEDNLQIGNINIQIASGNKDDQKKLDSAEDAEVEIIESDGS